MYTYDAGILRGRIGCIIWDAPLFCFFFSSRRRHTRLQGDWSSDVCSSDLLMVVALGVASAQERTDAPASIPLPEVASRAERSEERRVGKECRSRWSPYH